MVLEMSSFLIPLAGKRSKTLSKEPLILIPSVIMGVFRVSRRLWQPKSWAKLCISLKIMLLDAMVIHCAALMSKLILSLLFQSYWDRVCCANYRRVLSTVVLKFWTWRYRYPKNISYNICCRIQECQQELINERFSRRNPSIIPFILIAELN